MKIISSLTRACTALLLVVTGLAQDLETLRLAEEKELTELSSMSSQLHTVHLEELDGMLGWVHTEILSGEMNGEPVTLTRRTREVADIANARIRIVSETALWNEFFELIVMSYENELLKRGVEPTKLVYRWDDGAMWKQSGKGKKNKILGTDRPVADVEMQAFVGGLDAFAEGKEIQMVHLDPELGTIDSHTYLRKASVMLQKDGKGVKAIPIESSRQGGSVAYMGEDGAVISLQAENPKLLVSQSSRGVQNVREALASNEALLQAAVGRAREAWKNKGGQWSNAEIGLRFKAPKRRWMRSSGLQGTTVFKMAEENSQALLMVEIAPIGRDLDLESHVKAFARLLGTVNDIKVGKTSKDKFAKRPALRLGYTHSDDNSEIPNSALFFVSSGLVYRVTTIWTPKASKTVTKAMDAMARSIRFIK